MRGHETCVVSNSFHDTMIDDHDRLEVTQYNVCPQVPSPLSLSLQQGTLHIIVANASAMLACAHRITSVLCLAAVASARR